MYTSLINAGTLQSGMEDSWVIVDCRFDLTDSDAGRQAYAAGHIPGAVYAHLSSDLSGPPVTDHGRHPMPTPDALKALFGRLGISNDTQVIVYDDMCGAFAGRLWWMLRYMGHESVAVLNGGYPAWQKAGYEVETAVNEPVPASFDGEARSDWLIQVAEVPVQANLFDSRDPARYRGEMEPLDPAAGHIPGARNYFWKNNIDESGCFRPADDLREQLLTLLNGVEPEQSVFYCGSGVTACHNLLAMAYAGLGAPKLYAGSWSEWSSDPARPVATGEE